MCVLVRICVCVYVCVACVCICVYVQVHACMCVCNEQTLAPHFLSARISSVPCSQGGLAQHSLLSCERCLSWGGVGDCMLKAALPAGSHAQR